MRKGFWRRLGTIVLCVALSVGALTAIARWTGGSYDIVSQIRGDRNPANLLTVEDYTVEKNKDGKMKGATGYGVEYTVKDDGRVSLSGTNKGFEDTDGGKIQFVPLADVTLKSGTYTISGYEKAQVKTMGVYAKVGGNTYYGDIEGKFTIDAESTVEIGFYIANDVNTFGKTLYPVLVSGEVAGAFYTK